MSFLNNLRGIKKTVKTLRFRHECRFILRALLKGMTSKESKEFVDLFNAMSGRIKTATTKTITTRDKTKSTMLLLEDVKKVGSYLKDEGKHNF